MFSTIFNTDNLKALLSLALIGFVIFLWTRPDSPREEREHFDRSARSACMTLLQNQLNNPRSVEWVNRLNWPIALQENGLYYVQMTFRAENPFGAIITQQSLCLVSRDERRARAISIE